MIWRSKPTDTMQQLLSKLTAAYPKLHFVAGDQFCWSPETQKIYYKAGASGQQAEWSLLHETGHALLGHRSYEADYELLRLEIAAWERAKELAGELSTDIDPDHIQDCLDTYRDWLYKRSICPRCTTKSFQQSDFAHYRCFNCHTVWRVSTNRFGRAYRRHKDVPQAEPAPVFHFESKL
jgi:hypothetical protein